jgi:hypothetical protein
MSEIFNSNKMQIGSKYVEILIGDICDITKFLVK